MPPRHPQVAVPSAGSVLHRCPHGSSYDRVRHGDAGFRFDQTRQRPGSARGCRAYEVSESASLDINSTHRRSSIAKHNLATRAPTVGSRTADAHDRTFELFGLLAHKSLCPLQVSVVGAHGSKPTALKTPKKRASARGYVRRCWRSIEPTLCAGCFPREGGPTRRLTRCVYDNEGRCACGIASRPERDSSTPWLSDKPRWSATSCAFGTTS
jgi:hypothetical protein